MQEPSDERKVQLREIEEEKGVKILIGHCEKKVSELCGSVGLSVRIEREEKDGSEKPGSDDSHRELFQFLALVSLPRIEQGQIPP